MVPIGTRRRLVRGAGLIALVYIPVAAVLLFVRYQTFVEPQVFADSLRDRGSEWYSSGLAIVGLALWIIAALVGLAGALVARSVAALRPNRRFLFEAAAVSVMLGADDALQLHDPATLGLPTALVLAIESAVVLAVLVSNRRVLLQADVGLLVVTLGFGALWILAKGVWESRCAPRWSRGRSSRQWPAGRCASCAPATRTRRPRRE